ncbi:MAG: tRNA pseudouridine(13) synthase TruD [Candidatus Anstonellales archaeon]
MLSYSSRTAGIGGEIKSSPEDFVVEEILPDGTVLEIDKKINFSDSGEKFLHFVLQKRNFTTEKAIKTIARDLRISPKRFNYAGNKDRIAVTTQRVSVFGVRKEELFSKNLTDIKINGAWYEDEKVRLGELLGNRFKIKIKNAKNTKNIEYIYSELEGKFPNYFGGQRFGSSRKNTHKIGLAILKNRFDEAAGIFLTDAEGEKNEKAVEARTRLKEEQNFSKALRYFPKHLHLERKLLEHLAKNPNDFVNAFRKLPRFTLLLFVHAFQSHLFNLELSERIKNNDLEAKQNEYCCGENFYGFPDMERKQKTGWLVMNVVGYDSELNEYEKELLGEFEIERENFKVRSFPEISSRGSKRTAFSPFKDFYFSNSVFHFSLPKGSYATSALREFLKA